LRRPRDESSRRRCRPAPPALALPQEDVLRVDQVPRYSRGRRSSPRRGKPPSVGLSRAHRQWCRHAPPCSNASSDLPEPGLPRRRVRRERPLSWLPPSSPARLTPAIAFASFMDTVPYAPSGHLFDPPFPGATSAPNRRPLGALSPSRRAPLRGQTFRQTGGPRRRGRRALPTSASASGRARRRANLRMPPRTRRRCSSTLQTWRVTRL
jgi:hypothetical protein